MKENLKTTLSVLFIITIGIILYVRHKKNEQVSTHLEENGKVCIGEIVKVRNQNVVFNYSVEDVLYSKKIGRPFRGIQPFEKYEVLYDENFPKKSNMQFSRPIIEDSLFVNIKPKHIRIHTFKTKVEFSYEYNLKTFERSQMIFNPPWFDTLDFVVKVNMENPKIAFLFPEHSQ